MTDKALQFWNGESCKREWEKMVIAAYSFKDAVQLYVEAGGGPRGAQSQIANYFGKAAGSEFLKNIPNPHRGCYFGDRTWHSRMFIEPKSRSIVEEAPADAQEAAAAAPAPESYGKLSVGFTRGVKVDEWTFSSPHSDRAHADSMKAEVRMIHADDKGRVRKHGSHIIFSATSEVFGRGVTYEDSNIEVLFDKVQEAFRTYDLAKRGVVWEDWLEVKISPEHFTYFNDKDARSGGFSIGYKRIKRGIDPRNGRVMTIHDSNRVVTDFPKPRKIGDKWKDKNFDDWAVEREAQYAYLPATPDNLHALDSIIAAVGNARAKLEVLLTQEKIENTLASVPTVPLLESKS